MKGLKKETTYWSLALLSFLASQALYADPPARVARLAHIQGAASFSPAGEQSWVSATPNRPLVLGDRLWTDKNSAAMLQLGDTTACVQADTAMTISNLNNRVAQFQLTQGAIDLHINRMQQGQEYEINTPNLAFVIQRPGDYHFEVDEASTQVTVINGQGEAYGKVESFFIDRKKSFQFSGNDLQYKVLPFSEPEKQDLQCADRFPSKDKIKAALYVSDSVIGFEDLDRYGEWHGIEQYGPAWTPTKVAKDWAPYRDGHWAWIDPWGWTWVGSEAWGFAPYHYGRWTYTNQHWYWVPGPRKAKAIYAPALVGFINDIALGKPGEANKANPPKRNANKRDVNKKEMMGWFPLGPGELYSPPYQVSLNYFYEMNRSNTVANDTSSSYQGSNAATFSNLQAARGITIVPKEVFLKSLAVNGAALELPPAEVAKGNVGMMATIAPEQTSVIGVKPTTIKPAEAVEKRAVMVKMQLPPAVPSFAAKQATLNEKPGQPFNMENIMAETVATPPNPAPISKKEQTPVTTISGTRDGQPASFAGQPNKDLAVKTATAQLPGNVAPTGPTRPVNKWRWRKRTAYQSSSVSQRSVMQPQGPRRQEISPTQYRSRRSESSGVGSEYEQSRRRYRSY